MKKHFLVFSVLFTSLILMAFGVTRLSDSEKASFSIQAVELDYNIDSRYGTTVTKEKLHKATSVVDVLPRETSWPSYPIHTLNVTIFQNNLEITESGNAGVILNNAQKQLLRSIDYSESFRLVANCKGKHKDVPKRETYDLTYYITVTPEIEAEYSGGKDAIIAYLKENSRQETVFVKEDQLERGNVIFTVTKTGTITNVQLSSTSGYPSLDEVMIELISNLPGTWNPATDAKGVKIDQELVFSFGRGGC